MVEATFQHQSLYMATEKKADEDPVYRQFLDLGNGNLKYDSTYAHPRRTMASLVSPRRTG